MPLEFGVNQVIGGCQEAIPMMKVGEKWRLIVPPHLTYGERGFGTTIHPNTTLYYEIELI